MKFKQILVILDNSRLFRHCDLVHDVDILKLTVTVLPTQTCAVTLSAGPMPSEGVGGIALTDRAFIFSEWPPSAEKGVPSNYHRKKEKEGSTVLRLSLVPKFKVEAEISFMFFFFIIINCTWN